MNIVLSTLVERISQLPTATQAEAEQLLSDFEGKYAAPLALTADEEGAEQAGFEAYLRGEWMPYAQTFDALRRRLAL